MALGYRRLALLGGNSTDSVTLMKEFEIIHRYFAPLAGEAGLGLRDDAALLTPPAGKQLVITQDALTAGVHFFADDSANLIARKLLRVNLSDLAAKGAEPLGYLLSLLLPDSSDFPPQTSHRARQGAKRQGCGGASPPPKYRSKMAPRYRRARHGGRRGAAGRGEPVAGQARPGGDPARAARSRSRPHRRRTSSSSRRR